MMHKNLKPMLLFIFRVMLILSEPRRFLGRSIGSHAYGMHDDHVYLLRISPH
jgi:hypothetical protein